MVRTTSIAGSSPVATTGPSGGAQLLEKLSAIKSDSLLALIALANADTRPEKIDVGVGVFRDASGNTPPSTVCIHHPRNDVKSISLSNLATWRCSCRNRTMKPVIAICAVR